MLRHTRKTDIYSVSVADGKRALVFSDEGTHLETQATGAVSGTGKAYMLGLLREWQATPAPHLQEDKAFCEIALDGSNHFRRIADAQPNQTPTVLNAQGSKAAVESFANGKFAILIYSVPEWKLLATWDLAKLAQTHCPDCTPPSYGWLADGNRLFVKLVVGGEDDAESEKANHAGTYILSEDGADLGPIPAEIGAFKMAGYFHPNFIERNFIGQLPDGRYLFLDYGAKLGKSPGQTEPFLIISATGSKLQKQFPLKFPMGGSISPSGKYLAYLESRTTPDYRSELHLWVKDLESGAEKELLATPPPKHPTSPEPNVTLSILGWINN